MIKKGLKYLVKKLLVAINFILSMIGWTLIGIVKIIGIILLKYYQFKIYIKWEIR